MDFQFVYKVYSTWFFFFAFGFWRFFLSGANSMNGASLSLYGFPRKFNGVLTEHALVRSGVLFCFIFLRKRAAGVRSAGLYLQRVSQLHHPMFAASHGHVFLRASFLFSRTIIHHYHPACG